jgi:RNA polymerase sigma factor (sigma-70 family)
VNITQCQDEEFKQLLKDYSLLITSQVQRYNLPKYGLDPEDIKQDVKLRIWKLLQSGRTIKNRAPYLRRIVNSVVIDQLRKRRRDENLYNHERLKQIAEQDLLYRKEVSRQQVLEEAVGRAVNRLIRSRRQVVRLYLLNLTIQEISTYLKWTQDKTRNLLYRGLADLRKSLRVMDTKDEDRS